MNELPEILLIDKPKGISSSGMVCRLRKKFDVRKIGHAGTLDPLASGLMIVGLGKGTKKISECVGLTKEYVAEVRLGERRTTGDLDGDVVESTSVTHVSDEEVRQVLTQMLGTHLLPVPVYSAVKKGGVPFYRLAHRALKSGTNIPNPMREMEVIEAELLHSTCEEDRCVLTVRFLVGSGTYIRTLGEELGRRLGYPATLQNLRRTKVGDFKVEDAEVIEMELQTEKRHR